MLDRARDWFGSPMPGDNNVNGHGHRHDGSHGHTHGVIDAMIATTQRGIWGIKWSFIILAITAALQVLVVLVSSSVALLADTIHNVGDATTAIPLWIAFVLARRKPTSAQSRAVAPASDDSEPAMPLTFSDGYCLYEPLWCSRPTPALCTGEA